MSSATQTDYWAPIIIVISHTDRFLGSYNYCHQLHRQIIGLLFTYSAFPAPSGVRSEGWRPPLGSGCGCGCCRGSVQGQPSNVAPSPRSRLWWSGGRLQGQASAVATSPRSTLCCGAVSKVNPLLWRRLQGQDSGGLEAVFKVKPLLWGRLQGQPSAVGPSPRSTLCCGAVSKVKTLVVWRPSPRSSLCCGAVSKVNPLPVWRPSPRTTLCWPGFLLQSQVSAVGPPSRSSLCCGAVSKVKPLLWDRLQGQAFAVGPSPRSSLCCGTVSKVKPLLLGRLRGQASGDLGTVLKVNPLPLWLTFDTLPTILWLSPPEVSTILWLSPPEVS